MTLLASVSFIRFRPNEDKITNEAIELDLSLFLEKCSKDLQPNECGNNQYRSNVISWLSEMEKVDDFVDDDRPSSEACSCCSLDKSTCHLVSEGPRLNTPNG